MSKAKKNHLSPRFKIDNFHMIRLFFSSIAVGLLLIANIQKVSADHPSNKNSFTQFCRDLEVKQRFTANTEAIAKFVTKVPS